MPTELGVLVRTTRQNKGIGLRALAREIKKSPSFLVGLETGNERPSATVDTLRAIASALDLDADRLITLAGKVPEDAAPENALDAALFRQVKELPDAQKHEMLRKLRRS